MAEQDDLQFDTVEYQGGGPQACANCGKPLQGTWWGLGPHALDPECKDLIAEAAAVNMTPAALGMGLVFGIGASVIGAGVWGGIRIATNYDIGLIAIAVGWFVAWSITRGSGSGGWPYQAMAVVLTYVSVAMSFALSLVAEASAEGAGAAELLFVALVGSVGMTIGLIPLVISNGGIIFMIILGFALYYAFQNAAAPHIVFDGPFQVQDG